MKTIRILVLTGILALLLPMTVYATGPLPAVNSATFYCDAVEMNYSIGNTGYTDPISLFIYDGSDPATANRLAERTNIIPIVGTYDIVMALNTTVPEGTTLYIFANYYMDYIVPVLGLTPSGECSGQLFESEEEAAPFMSAPIYSFFGGEGARAAIFIINEDNGSNNPVFTLYDVNENSQGYLLFFISLNAMNQQYPADAGETVLIFENDAEFITLYRLANGVFQINLGPDAEGKVHVLRFTWDGGEPANVTYDTYFVASMLPLWVMTAFAA